MEKNKAEIRRIETVALDTLVMDGENARLHNRRNLDAIKQSIQKFGQYRPFVVNRRDRRIAVGNGMLLAMRELGFSEGAALFLDLSPEEFRRLSIADNRSGDLSANDPALLLGRLKSLPEELLSLSGFLSADLDILREESRSGRELWGEFFSSVRARYSLCDIVSIAERPLPLSRERLKAALEFEFNLPYPDGSRMGMVDEAVAAFTARQSVTGRKFI